MQPPDRSLPLPERLAAFLSAHSPALLTVGLLEPEYDLADADRRDGRNSASDIPRAGLLIVGAGSLEESLRAQIASTPYRDHVLLYGDMPHAVTLRATLECDVLLRTTLYDGDSVSVREALYIGTPVIATDNGMRPEGVHLIPAVRSRAAARCGMPMCSSGEARAKGARRRRAGEYSRGGSSFTKNCSASIRPLPEAERDIAGAKAEAEARTVCPLVVVLEIAAVVPARIEAEDAVSSAAPPGG